MNHLPANEPSPTVLQASKWLQLQTLLETVEMESLLKDIAAAKFYIVGRVTNRGEGMLKAERFLEKYGEYISQLKSGVAPDVAEFRTFFSSALTFADDHVFSISAGENKQIIRACKPVVQMQLHMMGYSALEKKFRPMILGKDSIHWGVQFSYPQLYLNPETKKVEKVLTDESFPNTPLFRTIQGWIRKNTLPTPFLVGEERINVPIRLGKLCFAWINSHPQLRALGIKVADKKGEDI